MWLFKLQWDSNIFASNTWKIDKPYDLGLFEAFRCLLILLYGSLKCTEVLKFCHKVNKLIFSLCEFIDEVFGHYSLHHHPNPTVEHCEMVCICQKVQPEVLPNWFPEKLKNWPQIALIFVFVRHVFNTDTSLVFSVH